MSDVYTNSPSYFGPSTRKFSVKEGLLTGSVADITNLEEDSGEIIKDGCDGCSYLVGLAAGSDTTPPEVFLARIEQGGLVPEYYAVLEAASCDVYVDNPSGPGCIAGDYGAAANGHGLFGYSYGGLFSLYAWLAGATIFETVGAGSPGVIASDSLIFALLDELGDSHRTTKLHITLNERELIGDLAVYRSLARNTAIVLDRLISRTSPVTSTMLRETHVTGLQASFLSYLRNCRPL